MKKIRNLNCVYSSCNKDCHSNFVSKMNIISIFETDNRGKTALLLGLIDMLKNNPDYSVVSVMPKNARAKDEVVVFYHIPTKKYLGVTSMGDSCAYLARDFLFMQNVAIDNGKKGCDLYICASHIWGCTLDWLLERAKNGMLLRWRKEPGTAQLSKLYDIIDVLLKFL